MNILFICDEYPPGKSGGIGTAVQLLARQLVKQGHGVWVSGLYAWPYGQKDRENDQGVNVIRHRYGLKTGSENLAYKLYKKMPGFVRSSINGKKAFDKYIASLHALVEAEKIAVIEVPDWNTFALHIGFTVQWPAFKAPLVVKGHGSLSKIRHDLGLPVDEDALRTDLLLYDRADAICAVSKDTAATNRTIFKVKQEIKVLYNGIEIPEMPVTKRLDDTAIYSGSLTPQKGVYQLVKAWNLMQEQLPQTRLLIYGKGKTEPLLALLSEKAKASVTFGGFVSRERLFEKLGTATMAVLPSYSETFGLGAVEAMSAGCPVIFTKRACGPEIVSDGKDGLLVEPDKVEEIAEGIVTLFRDKTLRNKLSQNGRATAIARFDIRQSAVEHIAYYTQVIGRFGRRQHAQ